MSAPTQDGQPSEQQQQQQEQSPEDREAFQYWGYLFKPDKTGTERLKGLLSGMKDIMVCGMKLRRLFT